MTGPTPAALDRLFEEASKVLETQVEALQTLDEKSAQLLRFNLLVSGLVVTAASLVVRSNAALEGSDPLRLALVLLGLGLAFLVASTALALFAHRAETYRIGIRSEGLVDALEYETDEYEFMREAVRSYHHGIVQNRVLRDRSIGRLSGPPGCCWQRSRSSPWRR